MNEEQSRGGLSHAVRRKSTFAQTARAVFWAFLGVRKRAHYEADTAQLNPVHVVIMGIVGAALFIVVLLAVIEFVVLR